MSDRIKPVSRKKPSNMRPPGHKMHTGLLNLIEEIAKENKLSEMVMVEVGSYQGESTEMFANAGFKEVIAVDPWVDEGETTTYGTPYANVEFAFDERLIETANVTKVKDFSVNAAKDVEDGSLDFVYIDALHTYEALKEDIAAWLPKIKKGGFIGGHDAAGRWGKRLRPAVEEAFGKNFKLFIDTSWLVKLNASKELI